MANKLSINFSAILSKKHDRTSGDNTKEGTATPINDNLHTKLIKQVLLIPGKVISMSILLNQKARFASNMVVLGNH